MTDSDTDLHDKDHDFGIDEPELPEGDDSQLADKESDERPDSPTS